MRLTTLRWRDERGSMPMALLVITVGLALSAAITPIVVRQFQSTRNLASRDVALNAAQAGMDMVMAQVRAASDTSLNGLLEDLPACVVSGDAGVSDAGESMPYYVTVDYRDQDNKPLGCPVNSVPTTALLTSVGYGTSVRNPSGTTTNCKARPASPDVLPCRVLTATYVFSTSNTTIPGGQIRIDTSTLGDMCIDAGTTDKSPAPLTMVVMKPCNGGSTQQFAYTKDLFLKLIYSESSTAPYGMCLDTLPQHKSANGNYVKWDVCPADRYQPTATNPTNGARFQWSLDGSSRFHSTGCCSGGKPTIENLCLTPETANSNGSKLVLATCASAANQFIWRSGAGIGAGMAGDETAQLVNYEQFSRCLDVTGQSVTSSYMIAWFCKQAPSSVVDWNQIWTHPVPKTGEVQASGQIIVTTDGSHSPINTPFCLKSPGSVASNAYPTVTNCSTAAALAAPENQWIVFHDTGTYATSYVIKDYKGYCLAPTSQNANPKDVHTDGTSKIKVAVCDGSELQKWNAPANVKKPSPLSDLMEQ
jgi:hypothetical protein